MENNEVLGYVTPSVRLIALERKKQLHKGFSIQYDKDINQDNQLSLAASFLAHPEPSGHDEELIEFFKPEGWSLEYWESMCNKTHEERLIIAGALIAAELDRIGK